MKSKSQALTPLIIFSTALLVELGAFFFITKFFPQNANPIGNMLTKLPIGIVMITTIFLLIRFIQDSMDIKEEIDELLGGSVFAKNMRSISVLFSIAGALVLGYVQYLSLDLYFLWGIYVQITIYLFAIARRNAMGASNLELLYINKYGHFELSKSFASLYLTKYFTLSVWFVGGNLFLTAAVQIGRKLDVQWEWYDLPGLYLFFVSIGLIFWGIFTTIGYIAFRYSQKRVPSSCPTPPSLPPPS